MVSHSGFLRTAISQTRYANADFRIFRFIEGRDGGDLKDVELEEDESTAGKGGMGRSEAGRGRVEARDFPFATPERNLNAAAKGGKSSDRQTNGEAANEVPN